MNSFKHLNIFLLKHNTVSNKHCIMQLDVWITLVHACTRGVETQPLLCAHPTPPLRNIFRQFCISLVHQQR